MKRLIIKYIFIGVFSIFCLFPCTVFALDSSNATVGTFKCWIITFNRYLNKDAVNACNVTVTNSKGEEVPIKLSLGTYSNTLEVYPPDDGYKPCETYTLTVNTTIRSYMQKNLSKPAIKIFTISDDTANNNKVVTFADKGLEQAIRAAINKPDGTIHKGDLSKVVTLNADSKGIANLQGIENLINLQSLSLKNNQIKDLTPLKNFTDLRKLYLSNNSITDITPLSDLKCLNTLYLAKNQVKDYSPVEPYYPNLQDLDFIIIKSKGVKVND